MTRAYNVVDADGHILEPLDLWDNYMEPRFRSRAPRIVKEADGKERLVIEEQTLGSKERGISAIGGVGARQGVVADNTMESDKLTSVFGSMRHFLPSMRPPRRYFDCSCEVC